MLSRLLPRWLYPSDADSTLWYKTWQFPVSSPIHYFASDFGAAVKITQLSVTIYGTLEYMPPEQLQHRQCPASDQYSCYHHLRMAHRQVPWILHCYLDPIYTVVTAEAPTLSPSVEDVILKALLKQPQQRYPTVSAFATALERAYLQSLQSARLCTCCTTIGHLLPLSSRRHVRLGNLRYSSCSPRRH